MMTQTIGAFGGGSIGSSGNDDEVFVRLMRLFESEYSAGMTSRHAAAVEKLCRQNNNGFLLRDLKHVNRLIDLLAARARADAACTSSSSSSSSSNGGGGDSTVNAKEQYGGSLKTLVQALGRRPLLRRSVREEEQSLSFLSQLISKLVGIIDDARYAADLRIECVSLIQKLARASVRPMDDTQQGSDAASTTGNAAARGGGRISGASELILVPVRMVEWGVRALEESNCAMALTQRLATLAPYGDGERLNERSSRCGSGEVGDGERLRNALLHALVPLSNNPISATQALSAGLINTLIGFLVHDEDDEDVSSAAIEVLWNLMEADRRETVIACNEASEALNAALTSLLRRLARLGYRERDKGVRNEILIIYKILIDAGCTNLASAAVRAHCNGAVHDGSVDASNARAGPTAAPAPAPAFGVSDFFDVLLAMGVGGEMEPPTCSTANVGSFCFTTDSDDYELKLLTISLLTGFIDCVGASQSTTAVGGGGATTNKAVGEKVLEYMHMYGMLKVALTYVAPETSMQLTSTLPSEVHHHEASTIGGYGALTTVSSTLPPESDRDIGATLGRWTSAQFHGLQKGFLTLLNRIVLQLPESSSTLLLNLGAAEALMRYAFLDQTKRRQHQQPPSAGAAAQTTDGFTSVGIGTSAGTAVSARTSETAANDTAKSTLQSRVMVLLRECVSLPGFRATLLSMGAVAMALDRGCTTTTSAAHLGFRSASHNGARTVRGADTASEELRGSAMNFLASLVRGSSAAREQLRLINGIDRLTDEVERLASSVDPMLPSAHALAVLACCWDGVIKDESSEPTTQMAMDHGMGHAGGAAVAREENVNLRIFVEDCDGLAVLLELLSRGNMFMAPVLLSMVADVLHGNPESHRYFHEWQSTAQAPLSTLRSDSMSTKHSAHAAQVILDIWNRYDPHAQATDLPKQTAGVAAECVAGSGSGVDSLPISREVLVYGSLSQQRRQASDSLLKAMDGTTMLGKCYAIFSALGFKSVHDYLPYGERATLAAIEQYVERRHGETWRSIKHSLESDRVVPTEADGERLTKSLRVLEDKTLSLVVTQREFLETARAMKAGQEQTHYNNIITQQEQATSGRGRSGIAGGRKINLTMKERLEAKERRERMLKKSFRPNAGDTNGAAAS